MNIKVDECGNVKLVMYEVRSRSINSLLDSTQQQDLGLLTLFGTHFENRLATLLVVGH